jgi:hypothetical protein
MPVYQPQLAYSPMKASHPDMNSARASLPPTLARSFSTSTTQARFSVTYYATSSTLTTVLLRYFAAAPTGVWLQQRVREKRAEWITLSYIVNVYFLTPGISWQNAASINPDIVFTIAEAHSEEVALHRPLEQTGCEGNPYGTIYFRGERAF